MTTVRATRAWRRHLLVLVLVLGWVGIIVLLAGYLSSSQTGARRSVTQRFAARVAAGASFASLYVEDILDRERAQAALWLAGARPSFADLAHASSAIGTGAAVLLDRRGGVLQVLPARPSLLGKRIDRHYAHLAAAVAGRTAVSSVVRSAARGVPVVGFAVPFPTRFGRRVFSGAFAVARTPLGAYMSHLIVVPGRRVYLVDASGEIIAASRAGLRTGQMLTGLEPLLARASARQSGGSYSSAGGQQSFVVAAVRGTPWRIVAVAPNNTLFDSTGGSAAWLAWLALGGLGVAGLVVLVTGLLLWRSHDRLGMLNRELDRLARIDSLTELRNRRDIEETLQAAFGWARRHDGRLSVLLIDVDHFKHINDTLGHRAGDAVLVQAANIMRSSLRTEDTLGRWGGEEFLAVLPDTGSMGAEIVAERLRAEIERHPMTAAGNLLSITVTVGAAEWNGETLETLVSRADRALYTGKAAGRNQVRLSEAAVHV